MLMHHMNCIDLGDFIGRTLQFEKMFCCKLRGWIDFRVLKNSMRTIAKHENMLAVRMVIEGKGCAFQYQQTGGGNSNNFLCVFSDPNWHMIQFDDHIFSNGYIA